MVVSDYNNNYCYLEISPSHGVQPGTGCIIPVFVGTSFPVLAWLSLLSDVTKGNPKRKYSNTCNFNTGHAGFEIFSWQVLIILLFENRQPV